MDGAVRLLFVENDDSFSFNVVALLPAPPTVATAREALGLIDRHDAVIVGPGPKDPERAGLVPVVHRAAVLGRPLLGICLGHQALGLAFGAQLIRNTPAHGKVATAAFAPSRLLPGLAGPFRVMRYHSLALTQVPAPLQVTALLADGTVMAIEHESLPMVGLQFHPDSHGTPDGRRFVDAFFRGVRG